MYNVTNQSCKMTAAVGHRSFVKVEEENNIIISVRFCYIPNSACIRNSKLASILTRRLHSNLLLHKK